MANEKRLIDLSTIGIGQRNPNAFNDPERAHGWNDLLKILEAVPTVDAVEVVRCKDCKYRKDPENRFCNPYCTKHFSMQAKDGDFCSYGDRKEGAGNG